MKKRFGLAMPPLRIMLASVMNPSPQFIAMPSWPDPSTRNRVVLLTFAAANNTSWFGYSTLEGLGWGPGLVSISLSPEGQINLWDFN